MKIRAIHSTSKSHQNEIISLDKKRSELHQEELGLGVPKGYFSQSRNNILAETVNRDKSRRVIKMISLSIAVAASILFFVTIGIDNKEQGEGFLANAESDLFVSSLFINEDKTDSLIEKYMLELPEDFTFSDAESDLLISSLFMNNHKVDMVSDDYMLKGLFE